MNIIRFAIIHSDTGQVESGANYPGCSASNPQACQPLTFAKIADAQSYAEQNDELIYVLGSALPNTTQWNALLNQVWDYVSNPSKLPPPAPVSGVSSTTIWIGAGLLAAYYLL